MTICWYVVRSKPQKESALCREMTMRGLDAYCPMLHIKPVNLRSRKTRPYFPGYVFVNTDLEVVGFSALNWLPYARGLVSFGGEPPTVPEILIKEIRKRVDKVNAAGGEDLFGLESGDEVIIQDGPFVGYKAIFNMSLSGNDRVLVLLKLLEDQNMRLELPANQVRKR